MAENWQQQKEMSNAFWLKLIIQLALKLPRWSIRLLLHPIVLFFIFVAPDKRRASYHYLTKALPYPPKIWHVYKHFYWFSAVLLDRVYFLSNQQSYFNITFANRQEVIDSFSEQPGQFFLSGHYGSVEALRTQTTNKQYEIKPVIKLDHNQTIVTLLKQLNPEFYEAVIPYKGLETTFEIYENLKKGVSIALLADRPIGDSETLLVDFLGEKIPLPKGVFEMILRFPFPTNFFFSQYRGGNRYHVEYFQLKLTTEDTPQILAQKFADILALQCQKSSYNWFNFYSYWEDSHYER
jgi:predicted LPLAT superfamily acyltransferase